MGFLDKFMFFTIVYIKEVSWIDWGEEPPILSQELTEDIGISEINLIKR